MLGYDTGVIAGAILLIIPEYALEDRPELVGLVVSSCTTGAMVGTNRSLQDWRRGGHDLARPRPVSSASS